MSYVQASRGSGAESVALALDVGGTWTRCAAVSCEGEILWRGRARTPCFEPHEVVLEVCVRLVQAAGRATRFPIRGVGVATTGPVDPLTGVLFRPPNAGPGLAGLRLGPGLSEAVGLSVRVERDTNAAALAEQCYGVAQGCDDFVYVTVSTGVGGAVVVGGQLLRGADGVAGEVGHVAVAPDGPVCGCGRRGCLEAVSAGPSLAAAALARCERAEAGGLRSIRDRIWPAPLEGHHVDEAARGGDQVAVEILAHAGAALASASADLVNVFNPRLLVLGGSVVRAQPAWIKMAQCAVAEAALAPACETAKVVAADLDDDGGLLGAALLVP